MGDISNLTLGWRTVMMGMICLPILVCAVILLFRKVETTPARYLGAFLLAAVLSVGPEITGYAGFYNVWPGMTYIPLFATELWLGPLIYLHADQLMRGGRLGWRKYLLVPGIAQSLYYTWAFFSLGDYKAKWAYNADFHMPFIWPVENLLTIALILFAVIAIWRMTACYRAHLNQTSSAALDYDPIWLRNLIIALVVAGSILVGLEIVGMIRSVSYDAAFPFQVLTMLVVVWIAIEAVWRLSQKFPKMLEAQTALISNTQETERDWRVEGLQLQDKVVAEKWFLEPRLSIRDVASRMGTNESYLSRTINQGLEQSFNGFINGLRVERAKELIKSSDVSILNIAFDSGFNSKATFNRVFRDISGETPSQFKKSQ